jgi:aspartate ammonia-lyase
MMPVIAYNLLEEISILANGIEAFTNKCVKGIKANEKICSENAERSSAVATALNPYIGYEKSAELAKEALLKNTTIRELVLSKKLMDKKKLDEILDLFKMTEDPDK